MLPLTCASLLRVSALAATPFPSQHQHGQRRQARTREMPSLPHPTSVLASLLDYSESLQFAGRNFKIRGKRVSILRLSQPGPDMTELRNNIILNVPKTLRSF